MPLFIKRLSHWSWFLLRTQVRSIHIDPAYLKSYGKPPAELNEKADILLYTHDHNDHCRKDTLPMLRDADTSIVAPASCARKIDGYFQIVKPGDMLAIGEVNIAVTYAYNLNRSEKEKIWHRKGNGVGYLLTIDGITVYHAGDTDFIPEMKNLGEVDVALLPVGGTFTMDLETAVQAVESIKPGIVIPMHNQDADLQLFKKQVEASSDVEVVLLAPGETFAVQ